MRARDFVYWLQGYFEIHSTDMPNNMKASQGGLTNGQVDLIRKHLHLVFEHEIDPSFGEDEERLKQIHNEPNVPITMAQLKELLEVDSAKTREELKKLIKEHEEKKPHVGGFIRSSHSDRRIMC